MSLNAVMIVPTGLGCSIGGHAGDATPAAKLLASVCDTLILHPNVVNASDINEMPSNSLYVDGCLLDRFLKGEVRLESPRQSNHILVVANNDDPVIRNGVNAACRTMGISAELLVLETPLQMIAKFDTDGAAGGETFGVPELLDQVSHKAYDALAVVTPIDVLDEVALAYSKEGGVNPWGGVEAKVSWMIASQLNKPVAHAPFIPKDDLLQKFHEVVDPRMAAEYVSVAYLFCIMKGLSKAPRPNQHKGLSVGEIDMLITPDGCWGPPHQACEDQGIPILVVLDNCCSVFTAAAGDRIKVTNYLEAAGWLAAFKQGMKPDVVLSPGSVNL